MSSDYAFTSYPSKNRDVVERLVRWLEEAGVPVWYDKRLRVGDNWPEELKKKIANARLVIAVVTSEYKNAKWMQKEISGLLPRSL